MKVILTYMMTTLLLVQPITVDKEKYKSDFKRIQTAYKSYPNLSFTVSYTDYHNSVRDTSVSAKYCFKGSKFYYKMAQVEVIKNDDYIISINHRKKDIVLYTASGYANDYMPIGLVDSFFNKSDINLQYAETNNGRTGRYIMGIAKKKTPFSKMELEFDKANYLVLRMRVYVSPEKVAAAYNEYSAHGPQTANVDYVFTDYKFSNIDDKLFDTRSYLIASGDQFKACGQYRGYHVVSLIPVHRQSK